MGWNNFEHSLDDLIFKDFILPNGEHLRPCKYENMDTLGKVEGINVLFWHKQITNTLFLLKSYFL